MDTTSTVYPAPKGGASLILSFRLQNRITLILGSGTLAASRAFSALEADSTVILIAKGGYAAACAEIQWRAHHSQLIVLDSDSLPRPSTTNTCPAEREAHAFGMYLDTFQPQFESPISLVCVTDTLLSTDPTHRRTHDSAAALYRVCRSRNIPVNVTDMPDLCDFTFTSTHRFDSSSGSGGKTPLQIGVTTNGQGCRLAGRIRREIIAKLPPEAGAAVQTVSRLREMAKNTTSDMDAETLFKDEQDSSPDANELNEDNGMPTPNLPVSPRGKNGNSAETSFQSTKRRMKWVAQISEYWPLSKLATMSPEEMKEVLNGDGLSVGSPSSSPSFPTSESPSQLGGVHASMHTLSLSPPRRTGKILLVGSGPGHPSLLTIATHTALTEHAHLVLSDKLVPAAVLALIPSYVEVRIARKFPGNADGAQHELMEAAVDAARRGLTVVRVRSILAPPPL